MEELDGVKLKRILRREKTITIILRTIEIILLIFFVFINYNIFNNRNNYVVPKEEPPPYREAFNQKFQIYVETKVSLSKVKALTDLVIVNNATTTNSKVITLKYNENYYKENAEIKELINITRKIPVDTRFNITISEFDDEGFIKQINIERIDD